MENRCSTTQVFAKCCFHLFKSEGSTTSPANATNLMVYKIYSDGFKGLDYSGAAAQSIILMLLIVVLTIFQFRFIERRVHYR